MDQERFDQITRTLATGQSRRGLLKGLTGTAIGGLLAAAGMAEASAKGPCRAPNTKYGRGKSAVCCTPGQTYDAATNACVTPFTCPQVDCNIGYDNGDGTCWYTPTGVSGVVCNNLYYGVGAGICDTNGNCLPPPS